MSKLLTMLRAELAETSSTVSIASYSTGPLGRRRRKKSRDPVDALIETAARSRDFDLQEAAVLFLEARSHVTFTGSNTQRLYTSTMQLLREHGPGITADSAFSLYARLNPLLETGSSEPAASQDVHKPFTSALAKEFDIEILNQTPVNDGIFVHVSREHSGILAAAPELRDFAASHGYLVLRRGTTAGDEDQTWVFVAAPNVKGDVGTTEDTW